MFGQRLELGPRVLDRNSRPQRRNCLRSRPARFDTLRHRNIRFHRFWPVAYPPHRELEAKVRRKHARQNMSLPIQKYRFADCLRIGSELALEEAPRNYDAIGFIYAKK